jgi:hypothetical protein
MTKKNNDEITITGYGACAMCHFRGHDGDSRRGSVALSNGRVACPTCGTYTTSIDQQTLVKIGALPAIVRDAVLALIEDKEPNGQALSVNISDGSGEGAVAQGFGPEDVPTSVTIALENDVKVSILFTARDVESAERAVPLTGSTTREAIKSGVAAEADAALSKLTALGFSFVHANTDGAMRRFALVKGYRLSGKPTVLGVRADISWIVL